MFLDSTVKSLELILGSAVTTTAMPITVDYVDLTSTTTLAGASDSQSNGLTAVTILTAPAASTTRKVNGITVYNADSVAKIVTVRLNNNATLRILVSVTLQVGDTLVYTDVNGWYSLDSSGSIKEVASGTLFGNITVAGIETDTAVGTQKVISQDASKFREGQQSTLTSGTAYSTNGNLLIMKSFTHNFGIDTSGNLTTADATDYCTSIFYSEDDKLKGFSSAAPVTGGTTPTISNTWYFDNITGNLWNSGLYTQGDLTAPTNITQLGGMFSTNTASGANIILRKSFTGTNSANITAAKSRGTNALPSIIVSGDTLFLLTIAGFDGTNYVTGGAITCTSEGTIGTNIIPSRWAFSTANSAGTSTEALRIDSSQNVLVTAPSGLGYGTGSGGTVAQAISRTTGVTLNKPTGQITMFTAAGSTTPASFTVTNSLVSANDVPTICIKSGATNIYTFMITAVAANSFVVTFWTTGGTASDTPVLQFNLGKGAIA